MSSNRYLDFLGGYGGCDIVHVRRLIDRGGGVKMFLLFIKKRNGVSDVLFFYKHPMKNLHFILEDPYSI